MASIYSAIGNEVRVKLLLCLSHQSKTVSEMIDSCGLAQSAVSQHLRKLKQSGLVTARKVGKTVEYSVANPRVIEICKRLVELDKENV